MSLTKAECRLVAQFCEEYPDGQGFTFISNHDMDEPDDAAVFLAKHPEAVKDG